MKTVKLFYQKRYETLFLGGKIRIDVSNKTRFIGCGVVIQQSI